MLSSPSFQIRREPVFCQKRRVSPVSTRTRRREAFTTIELLVVACLILILSLLGFAGLKSVSESGRNTACIAKQRQVGAAIMTFVQEHNGILPPSYENNSTGPGPIYGSDVPAWGPTWAEYIFKIYVNGNREVFRCPSRPANFATPAGYYPDYSYNERLTRGDFGEALPGGRRLASIANPSTKILIADGARYIGTQAVGGFYAMNDYNNIHGRHRGAYANILYLDLHAESHPRRLSDPAPQPGDPFGYKAFLPN